MTGIPVSISRYLVLFKHDSSTTIVAEKFKVGIGGCLEKVKAIRWVSKVKVKLLCASVVKEVLTGRKLPMCAILHKSKGSSSDKNCLVVCLDVIIDEFIPLKLFTIKESIRSEAEFKIQIVDGPAVVVLCGSDLHLYENRFGRCLNEHSFSCLLDSSKHANLKMTSSRFLSLYYEDCWDSYVIFILLENEKCKAGLNNTVQCVIFSESHFRQIDACSLIPEEYFNGCSSVLIKNLKFLKNSKFSSEIIIGTIEGYLVRLKDGYFITCTKVFEGPIGPSIQTRCTKQKGIYIAQSDESTVILDEKFLVSTKVGGPSFLYIYSDNHLFCFYFFVLNV